MVGGVEHRVEVRARLRHCTSHLVHENGSAKPTTTRHTDVGGGYCGILAHDNHLHAVTFALAPFRSQPEVEPITRVVLDDEQRPLRARAVPDGCAHSFGGRRREDVAAHRGSQATLSDVAAVRRLMSRSSSGDERHF